MARFVYSDGAVLAAVEPDNQQVFLLKNNLINICGSLTITIIITVDGANLASCCDSVSNQDSEGEGQLRTL
ncbi:MAG: hypothetical protein K2X81_14705 [Candidatus Obscuribacterales bacterium]|nr:hypothetical protein [Candidatus Obscuribacterales bacterium]